MMNQQQLMSALQQYAMQQKQASGQPNMAAPIQQPQMPMEQGGQGGGNSMLGFLGGLGDTKNASGTIEPSMLTQANQYFTGQQPWQQTQGQQGGQGVASLLSKFAGLL